MENKKSNKPLIIAIIFLTIALIAALALGGIYFVKYKNADDNKKVSSEEEEKPAKSDKKKKDKKNKKDKSDKKDKKDKDEADNSAAVNPVAGMKVIYSGSKKENDPETAILIQYLIDNGDNIAAEDIVSATVDDFDNNGTYEAFIFVGKKIEYDDEEYGDSGDYEGHMCFTNGEHVEEFDESPTGVWGGIDGIMEMDGRKYACASERYVTDYVTHVWSVYDNEAGFSEIDALGSISQISPIDFAVTDSCYDTVFDSEFYMMSGHSWKPYYFYYNKPTDQIYEYGGAYVAIDDIDALSATDLTAQIKDEGHEITYALYRENGILTVNYRDMDEKGDVTFGNINYDCFAGDYINAWSTGSGDIYSSDYNGIYVSTISDLYATYPEVKQETEDIELTVASYNNVIASRGIALLSGRNQNDEWVSIVIDKNTKMAPNDPSLFNDREDSMSAVEWIEKLIQIEKDSDWGTMKVEGVYKMTVTNNHADYIEGR